MQVWIYEYSLGRLAKSLNVFTRLCMFFERFFLEGGIKVISYLCLVYSFLINMQGKGHPMQLSLQQNVIIHLLKVAETIFSLEKN